MERAVKPVGWTVHGGPTWPSSGESGLFVISKEFKRAFLNSLLSGKGRSPHRLRECRHMGESHRQRSQKSRYSWCILSDRHCGQTASPCLSLLPVSQDSSSGMHQWPARRRWTSSHTQSDQVVEGGR